MAERRACTVLVGKPGKDRTEDLSRDARIILKWIYMRSADRAWAGLTYFRIGTSGGLLWTRR